MTETEILVPGNLPIRYDERSLVFTGRISFKEAEQITGILTGITGAVQWWFGDLLNMAEIEFGERYAQLIPENLDPKTLGQWKWVANKIPAESRRRELSWSHYEVVAAMLEPDREFWLQEAEEGGWSVHRMRKEIKPPKAKETKEPEGSEDPQPIMVTCPQCGERFDWEI